MSLLSVPFPIPELKTAEASDFLAEFTASVCYNAYAAALQWRDKKGAKLPDFFELPSAERRAWFAVGETMTLDLPEPMLEAA